MPFRCKPMRIYSADKADVSALDRELDELVYALYALTSEEIKIVKGMA